MVPNGGVVKQEPPEVQQLEEEVTPGSGAVVAAAEAVAEPQINLMFGVSRFHCIACFRPIKPPTFKCEVGHLVCGTCRVVHTQACARVAAYAACPEVDVIVRDAKLPCPYSEFGCKSFPVYYQAADHERACPWAPCYCPALGCEAYTSPVRLVDHFRAAHGWPVTEVGYAKPCQVALPRPPEGLHVLVGRDDGRVFLVSASPLGAAAVAASLACVRANGDAAPGVPQYKCTLWVESRRSGGGVVASLAFAVLSKNMSGGFVAAEHGAFLAVTPDLLDDASGERPVLKIRIDKVGGAGSGVPAAAAAAATARSPNPPASCSGRLP